MDHWMLRIGAADPVVGDREYENWPLRVGEYE